MSWVKVNQGFNISGYLIDKTNNNDVLLDGMIVSVAVRKDFMDDILPLYVVTLECDYDTREIIRTCATSLTLTCDEYNIPEDVSNETEYDITENTFSVNLKIFDPNLQEIDIKQTSDDESEELALNQKFTVVLNCIPYEAYEQNSAVINVCYNKASMNEILVDILSDKNRELYLDNSDNSNREETILIPQMNKSNAISFLQNVYGIYNDDAYLFFDDHATYLTKKYNTSVYSTNSISVILISQNDLSTSGLYENVEIDENNNIKKITKSSPISAQIPDLAANIIGGTTIFGKYGSDFSLVTRNFVYDKNESKVRYKWNNMQNDLFEKTVSNIPVVSGNLIFSNLSPRLINLRTLVEIQSTDESLTGRYNIQSLRYMFSSTNKKNFNSSIVLSIMKK